MYVLLICDDNSMYGSKKERLMQKSKLVNNLVFIVNPIYNGIDMTDATVMMEYILPVSRKYKTEFLVLSDERYKDCYLQYKLPLDTSLSREAGKIEIQLTFVKTELDEHGNDIQRVRKISPTTIEIVPIAAWSDIIPDEALTALDERLIKLDAQMRGLNEYMNVLDYNVVDDLVYDEDNDTLQLSSKGVGIGNKVSIREMLDDGVPVIDLESNSDSNNDNNESDNNECDCGCEDNVVEFGYYGNTNTPKPTTDDNVVEF